MSKTLIAFYSRAGQNYVSGDIVDLEVGNIKQIDRQVQSQTK
jgi:hypothetical protein